MAPMRQDLERALSPITSELLNEKGYIAFVDIFMRLGYLSQSDYENWRFNPINSSIAFSKVINPQKDAIRLRSSLRCLFCLF